jgi:hypothetical protein
MLISSTPNPVHPTRGPSATRIDATSLRRVSHGATAFAHTQNMAQPQDGAAQPHSKLATLHTRIPAGAGMEPEDARLTGATRSLFRRLMGLNVMRAPAPMVPVVAMKARLAIHSAVAAKQVA